MKPEEEKKEVWEAQDFATTLKQLEETVKSLESGELSLEESLKKFEDGIRIARHLEKILDAAERKVEEILKGPDQRVAPDEGDVCNGCEPSAESLPHSYRRDS